MDVLGVVMQHVDGWPCGDAPERIRLLLLFFTSSSELRRLALPFVLQDIDLVPRSLRLTDYSKKVIFAKRLLLGSTYKGGRKYLRHVRGLRILVLNHKAINLVLNVGILDL